MSFTLYNYVLSGNCYKIRLMAALLKMEYKTVPVDFYPGFEHRTDSMLALNPAGTLPILTTDTMVLTQTSAMLIWLAATYDRSGTWDPVGDAQARAEIAEWLAFSSKLTDSVGIARLHDMLDWPANGAAAKAAALKDLRQLELKLTDRILEGGLWLVGDSPTIADIACFPYAALSPDAGLEHDGHPAIRNWLHAIRGLPGFITMPGIHYLHELSKAAHD